LAFRAQRNGSKLHLCPNLVLNCDWNPNEGDHVPVQQAYYANDEPLFREMYSKKQTGDVSIDYFNWTDSPAIWERRFGSK